ncbi:MAG: DUF4251 domain-containing protein [Bacteroidetes bacterium]|nr:DUF4251 domain-containing protein [Bacteroidota bacterium]MCL6104000.1 DUF4251 domain-containing protein [Bacteroidota bacterium]
MKTKITQLLLLILICTMPVLAQMSNRKAEKEERRVAKEKEIAALIESKNFEFRANRAIPTGFRSVDLTTNPNFIRFSPDSIVSEMPFFGRAYTVPYGGDAGLKFEGKPELFKIGKKKKNYSVEAKVKADNDFYTLNLTISFEGSSSMSVTCNNRASISYNGEIYPQEKPKGRK